MHDAVSDNWARDQTYVAFLHSTNFFVIHHSDVLSKLKAVGSRMLDQTFQSSKLASS